MNVPVKQPRTYEEAYRDQYIAALDPFLCNIKVPPQLHDKLKERMIKYQSLSVYQKEYMNRQKG